jgi:hypothetical protein
MDRRLFAARRALLAVASALAGALGAGCNDSPNGAGDGGFVYEAGALDARAEAGGDATTAGEGGSEADAATGDGASQCATGGTPTMHTTSVTTAETWGPGVHIVPSSLSVTTGGHLTIAPCADVRLGTGASITVTTTAVGIDAVGAAGQPILFEPNGSAPWGAIDVTAPAVAHLAYATLTGGGTGPHASAPNGGATIAGHGTDPQRPVAVDVQHVSIQGSAGLGMMMRGASFDPASADLTIAASGWYPLYTGIGSAGGIPQGAYTGNAIDQILLQSYDTASALDDGPLLADVTVADHGVPYLVGTVPTVIKVGNGTTTSPPASLKLLAGVTMLFQPEGTGGSSGLRIVGASDTQAQGALIVQGTATSPVVFDSAAATPASGDWMGVYFSGAFDPRSSITNAHIAHAGGPSATVGICPSTANGNSGAVTCAVILFTVSPPTEFISSTVVSDSACGVYRDWAPSTEVDFTAGNTFTGVPGCTQTSLPASGGACAMCPTSP